MLSDLAKHLQPEGTTSDALPDDAVDIEMLDYKFIEQCTDIPLLEKIIDILKSGKEGLYPHLENFACERLYTLDPKKRIPYNTLPNNDEMTMIEADLKSWEAELKSSPRRVKLIALNKLKVSANETSKATDLKKTPPTNELLAKRIGSHEYAAWDKFVHEHVQEEDAISEEQTQKPDQRMVIRNDTTRIMATASKLPPNVSKSISEIQHVAQEMSHQHPMHSLHSLAEHERRKGNECMKAKEYDDAIQFYSRSLALIESSATYANRCLAYLKNGSNDLSIEDASRVLQEEPENLKVLLRRGLAYHQTGRYAQAITDFEQSLVVSPGNGEAERYLAASKRKFEEVGGIIEKKSVQRNEKENCDRSSTRLQIVEVEQEDMEESKEASNEAELDDNESEISSDEEESGCKITEL